MQEEKEEVEEGGSNYDLKREIGGSGEQVDGRSSLMMERGLEQHDEADEMAILERRDKSSMHLRDFKPTKQIKKGYRVSEAAAEMENDSIKMEENDILIDENDDIVNHDETFTGDMLPLSMC